ncbi:Protein RecA [Bienertia sinuspersici]
MKKDTENSQQKSNVMTKLKKNPRFAVELDGVHCFETIVPY